MADSEGLAAEVFLDGHIPVDQERVLVDALAALGVRAQAKVVSARRGLGELHWLILVSLPLQTFLSSVGSKLAEDGYQGLKRAVGRLLGRGQEQPAAEPPRPMVLQDTASRLPPHRYPGAPPRPLSHQPPAQPGSCRRPGTER
jgi:hypothetical protein